MKRLALELLVLPVRVELARRRDRYARLAHDARLLQIGGTRTVAIQSNMAALEVLGLDSGKVDHGTRVGEGPFALCLLLCV